MFQVPRNMKASTKRILSIMSSVALLIAVAVIYVRLINPAYAHIQKLRGEIQARENLLSQQTQAVNQIQNLISQLQNQNITQFQEQLFWVLPTSESVPQVLSQYQAISQASGLSNQSIGVNYLAIKPAASDIGLAKGIGTELYIENLLTQKRLFVDKTGEPLWYFKPKWISDNELQYEMPSGEKKIYVIPK